MVVPPTPGTDGAPPVDVLVVEDDGAVRRALERALALHGFAVRAAADGLEALQRIADRTPDLIVLDVGLPGPDGMRLAERLRRDGLATPILMLTARDAVGDRVAGLGSGADDYLVKPFALEELVARLRALLRRTPAAVASRDEALRAADLVLDVTAHRVRRGEREVELTPTEFAILRVLLDPPGHVASRERLADEVWDGADVGANALEQHVAGLRRRLEEGGEPRLVRTVRGVGYVVRAATPRPSSRVTP
jgi:two-component system response regulator MprA